MIKSPVYQNCHTNPAKKQVSFQYVEVREYELGLCDNPECYLGPAIGLGWNYNSLAKVSLEDYEKNQAPPRPSKELHLTRERRQEMLKNSAFTNKEIRTVTLAKAKTRAQRSRTTQNLHFAPIEEKLESLTRRTKRLILRRKKDAELVALWPGYKKGLNKRHSEQSTGTLDTIFSDC